jgi:hypothetical protein
MTLTLTRCPPRLSKLLLAYLHHSRRLFSPVPINRIEIKRRKIQHLLDPSMTTWNSQEVLKKIMASEGFISPSKSFIVSKFYP